MVEQKALKKANDTSKRYLGNIADDYVFLENKSKTQQDCIGIKGCLLYTSPSPRDLARSRMPSSA